LPVYGPFSTGGKVPSDLDECYTHSHDDIGVHYHSNFGGDTSNAFIACNKYYRASQSWDNGGDPNDLHWDGPLGEHPPIEGADISCPATEIVAWHSIVDAESKYFSTPPSFDSAKCVDVDRIITVK
jgi:hypothetical protein